jgi:gliding motility-associated-like protein
LSGTTINVLEDGSIVFEGATDDEFETTLNVLDPTADRTIIFPNQSGTVDLLDGIKTAAEDDIVLDGTDGSSTNAGSRLLLEDITDDTGCTVSILFDVVLPVLGYPDFDYDSFYLQTFDALTFNDPITFENLSTEKYLSVEWDFGDGNTSTENDPVHSYLKPGSYDVTIYVTYIGGCVYSLTKTIYIGNSYELEVPNAFTPNGDGHNDFFKPEYYGFTEIDLKVFDLWGTLIYYEKADTDQLVGWNARINGKPAENGNYIYQVTGTAYNKESVFKNGPFTLLK